MRLPPRHSTDVGVSRRISACLGVSRRISANLPLLECFYRWVAADVKALRERLVLVSVNLGPSTAWVLSIIEMCQLVSKDAAAGYLGERAVLSRLLGGRRPLGSERLAVAAPWRVKFDERKLPDASDGSAAAAGRALVAVVKRRGGSSRHLLRFDPVVKVVRREDSDAVFELHGRCGGEGEEERQHRYQTGKELSESL